MGYVLYLSHPASNAEGLRPKESADYGAESAIEGSG